MPLSVAEGFLWASERASVVQLTCLVDELWIHSRSWLTETRPSDEPFVHWVMVLKKSRMNHCDAVWIFCKVFENSSLPFWSHGLLGRLDFESVFALLKDFRPSLECCMEATEKCCSFSLFKPREDCDWNRLRHLITFIWSKILSLKTVLVWIFWIKATLNLDKQSNNFDSRPELQLEWRLRFLQSYTAPAVMDRDEIHHKMSKKANRFVWTVWSNQILDC